MRYGFFRGGRFAYSGMSPFAERPLPYEVEHADLQVQMQKLQDQLAQIQHRLHTLNESSADEA